MIKKLLSVFLKFGVVGFTTFVIDFGLTYLLKEKARVNKFLANTIGFLTAAVINFWLNRLWTFQSLETDILLQFLKFMAIASVGLLINIAILYFLNVRFKVNFYMSKIMAVIVVTLYNFSMNVLVTFAK